MAAKQFLIGFSDPHARSELAIKDKRRSVGPLGQKREEGAMPVIGNALEFLPTSFCGRNRRAACKRGGLPVPKKKEG